MHLLLHQMYLNNKTLFLRAETVVSIHFSFETIFDFCIRFQPFVNGAKFILDASKYQEKKRGRATILSTNFLSGEDYYRISAKFEKRKKYVYVRVVRKRNPGRMDE